MVVAISHHQCLIFAFVSNTYHIVHLVSARILLDGDGLGHISVDALALVLNAPEEAGEALEPPHRPE